MSDTSRPRSGTLGEAARRGMLVTATCRKCGHAASFLAVDLAMAADPAAPLEKLAFRCRECRERDCEVEARELDRDRRPNIVVWRPTRLR
ncbi:hypothetical protein [Aurantimonas coralicida]|uniref:hypothetical protein n=1 Tax=Aurantimonas coralicida TaxID=182270 RepID=UPI001E3E9080|nr:hypothetical protein [Aurantimonas coralicida]MCD1643408.1 hypothetical protein [Aurantimonas coralicida]